MQPARRDLAFDPERHAEDLLALIDEIDRTPELDPRVLDRLLRRYPKDGRSLFSKSEIIAGFRHFAPGRAWALDEAACLARLRLRPVRTLSGVTPVTVLTKPWPCPGRCIFCPDDPAMPKSYLSAEPGAQRALDHGFDPYRQTWSRLQAFYQIGHPVEKVELIVLGGTWSAYPERYQRWFARRCFDALNDFGRGIDGRGRAAAEGASGAAEATPWEALEAAQRDNEAAACRCVGLSVETRPDRVREAELLRLRRLGVTKLQIGLQSLSDRVLAQNRRGCDVAASRRALHLLRAAGFKIHAHWMANLLGSTPEDDARDFARLFDDPDFRPDELKVYPCSLVASAELMQFYRRGEWRPYGTAELTELLASCLAATPRWCRLTRVIRDFSAGDIKAGNTVANLREVAEARLRARGQAPRDIRAREIRGEAFDPGAVQLAETAYATSAGSELFLEAATPDDRLVGFLRLSLPRAASFVAELGAAAVIREVHVYGASLALGRRAAGAAQHAGLGRRLVARARERARAAGFGTLAVISAVGTRPWYRRLGFRDGALYQHRPTQD